MSLPTLKQQIYDSLSEFEDSAVREAMMNVMQATFVTLQSAPILDADILSKGQQIFDTLFSRYFKETMRVKTVRVSIIMLSKLSSSILCFSISYSNKHATCHPLR